MESNSVKIIYFLLTYGVRSIYFMALLARLQNSSLQMVEYCEFISLRIDTDSVSPVTSCTYWLFPVTNI